MKVQNTMAAAVVIDGADVIAPMETYECADKHKGVLELIEDGVLRRLDVQAGEKQNAKTPKE